MELPLPRFRMLKITILLIGLASCSSQFNFLKGNFDELDQQLGKFKDAEGKKWALLVAGSRFYVNYRHQADVCHAYQVVHRHGIPDEQIVVMMYDDIANADQNPVKGELINHPDGANVYSGVPKDYTGKDVTPGNFISILTGRRKLMKGIGSGKVVDSGPNDHVFVFFSDHGASGLIAFPSSRLYKDDLAHAIEYMHINKKYKQMVFYLESCESGSMFYGNLADNINVYATTASNRLQSSYACFYDQKRKAYLGDRYAVSWMEDSDKEDLAKESLREQYEITKAATDKSTVMQFGAVNMSSVSVGLFQGDKKVELLKPLRKILDDVPSPDARIHTLYNMIKTAKSTEEKNRLLIELNEEYKMREMLTTSFGEIATRASRGQNSLAATALFTMPQLHDIACYKAAVEWFDRVCYDLDAVEFAYRKLYILGNLCDAGVPTERILSAISSMCK